MSGSVRRIGVSAVCTFVTLAGLSSAQQKTTSTETRTFEVLGVNGNALTVREASVTKEYIVPDTFRFTVGGKELSVHELSPGMKGTATITTTTTVTPVTITEPRQAPATAALRAAPAAATQPGPATVPPVPSQESSEFMWKALGVAAILFLSASIWRRTGTTV